MMSVPSLQKLSRTHYGNLDILVATKYMGVGELLRPLNAPVRRILDEPTMCPTRDGIVTGMFMSSWSESLLRHRHPGYDQYVNAAPNMAPRGAHMISLIAYRCGVVSSLSEFPFVEVPDRQVRGSTLVVHLGSADPARVVCLPGNPMPGLKNVCIGLPMDPCPIWIDEDRRGVGFEGAVGALEGAALVVGSDSLFTHVSCLMGIPTLCIHTSVGGYLSYSREAYPMGLSMVADRGMASTITVRTKLLQLSDQENSDARSNRQKGDEMELHPETG